LAAKGFVRFDMSGANVIDKYGSSQIENRLQTETEPKMAEEG
jgi:hypothetical protein